MLETLKTLAAQITARRAAGGDTDYAAELADLRAMAQAGPQPGAGFKWGAAGTIAHLGDCRTPTETKKAVAAAMKAAGFAYVNSAKMMGGSETLHDFMHPEVPGIKYQLHMRPFTRWKEKMASFSFEVKTTRLTYESLTRAKR